jgi:hypothetical protein
MSAEKKSFGPTTVALLALHDREFFDRLLENPRTAIEQHQKELGYSREEAGEVIAMIEKIRAKGQRNPLDILDELRRIPFPKEELWPTLWPGITKQRG